MSLFTPSVGLIGGALIGASAGSLLILNGDVMGISGIISTALMNPLETIKDSKRHWKLVYLASFAINTGLIVYGLESSAVRDARLESDPDVPIASSIGHWIGGFLVGLGTKVGNGCTTGHGICGLARLSKRSFTAVITFMTTAIATRALTAPWTSWAKSTAFLRADEPSPTIPLLAAAVIGVTTLLAGWTFKEDVEHENDRKKNFGAAISAGLAATGLAISRMVTTSKVFDFLDICGLCKGVRGGSFDPTLAAVMGGGVLTSWLSYQYVEGHSMTRTPERCLSCPVALNECGFSVPKSQVIDWQLVGGAAIFGVGWGIAALCPGPALFHACTGNEDVVLRWFPAFLAGSYVGHWIKEAAAAAGSKKAKNV